MILDLILFVVNDLRQKKFSSFLTLFAISLGILTIFVIFLLSSGFSQSLEFEFEKMGSQRLYVTPSTADFGSLAADSKLNDNLLRLVKSKPYVEEVYPYVMQNVQLKYGREFESVMVFGSKISGDFFDSFNMEVEVGRIPKESEKFSVVLGPVAAIDTFSKDLKVGSNVYIEGVKFKVVGILKSVGNDQDDRNIYFNIYTLRDVLELGDAVGLFDVNVVDGYDVELAKSNLEVFFENRIGEDEVDIRSAKELLESFSTIMDIIKYTLGGIGFVALVVGALGIVNTMYVIVSEKRRDIGIMKAIGATDANILFMFVFEAGLFGFLGGLLGVVVSGGVAFLFEYVAQSSGFGFLTISYDWVAAFGLLVFSFLIGCVAGFLPSKNAADTNLIDAIRK